MQRGGFIIGKNLACFYLCVIGCLFLSCCEVKKGENKTNDNKTAICDWEKNGFMIGEDVKLRESSYLCNYVRWDHDDEGNSKETYFIDAGSRGDFFWYLGMIAGEDGNMVLGAEATYLLETYQIKNKEINCKTFSPRDVGAIEENGLFVGMDFTQDGKYLFRWAAYELTNDLYVQCKDEIIISDMEGDTSSVDFRDAFAEEDLEAYEPFELVSWPLGKVRACSGNQIWIMSHGKTGTQRFCIFDLDGNKRMAVNADQGQAFMQPFLNENLEVILPIQMDNRLELQWCDVEAKRLRKLTEFDTRRDFINEFCGMEGNNVYYQARDPVSGMRLGVVRWNVQNGEREWILGLDVNNMAGSTKWWCFDESNLQAIFLSWGGYGITKDWIISVSDEKNTNEKEIMRIADFSGASNILKKGASVASMENLAVTYQYEDASTEDARNQVLIELAQGKGPEIMFVRMDDFYDLSEKGILLDVSSYISEERKGELLPGALEIGRIENRILGIPLGVRIETLVVGKGIGKIEEWDIDTVTRLMEEGRLNGALKASFLPNSYLEPLLTVSVLTSYMLSNSFLINAEQGKSNFDDERFIKLLQLTRNDLSKKAQTEDEQNDLTWIYLNNYPGLIEFMANDYQENRMMGFPELEGKAAYLVAADGVLVINKNNTDDQAVKIFLESVTSKEIQGTSGDPQISIRKFNPAEYLTVDKEGVGYYFNSYRADLVDAMEPDDNPLIQAAQFLEKCVPAPRISYQVRDILLEELRAMYAENKNEKETAIIINNRVQLFLDEQ